MATFKASAATMLSQCTDNLLKDDCTNAIECELNDKEGYELNNIFFLTLDALINSFSQSDYQTQGLYRLSGNNTNQKDFLNCFENAPMTQIRQFIRLLNAIDRACVIKAIIRKMKNPIFPFSQRAALINVSRNEASNPWVIQNGGNMKSLKALQILCHFIPKSHREILFKLVPHLKKVIAEETLNKMSLSNISLLFTPLIFPVVKNENLKDVERDIESMSKLLAICIHRFNELFTLPDDLIAHVDNSLRLQYENEDVQLEDFLQNNESEPVTAPPTVYCSPSKSTTDYEMANLMANINSMKNDETKKRLIRRYQKLQRHKLGINENRLRKPLLNLNIMSKLSKSVGKKFGKTKSMNVESESEVDDDTYSSSLNFTDEYLSMEKSRHEFDIASTSSTNDSNLVNEDPKAALKKVPSREYLI